LPEWFLEDERKFMRPPPVYDQADLDEAKERLAAVDNRSIKKVAEAKFRKKKRAETKMSQARKRASTIMEQDDVPDVSKVREIEKIYAKAKTAARGKRREIKHVVARKFHKGNAGGPSVDKRMLNDARAQKRSLKAKGGVKKGGGGRGGGGGGRGGGNKGGGGGRGKKGF
jgi:AdoMet-dependent rRNA methyltransferase SPB1|tara:strand:+ start:9068 stop:9577 length:510 start_codon:yes stop_codon:yes gene_type:complete